jgi:hypothetical protein
MDGSWTNDPPPAKDAIASVEDCSLTGRDRFEWGLELHSQTTITEGCDLSWRRCGMGADLYCACEGVIRRDTSDKAGAVDDEAVAEHGFRGANDQSIARHIDIHHVACRSTTQA